MNLEELNKILLFGKSRAFNEEEFLSQMKHHNIEVTKEFSTDVDLLVDGRMMTPYEQNLSDELYEKENVSAISIDVLERELASHIDENTLLMSLKLSRDKERLKAFLQNGMIEDGLFFKLLKMYKWQGEDFFENDENRDVSAAFIRRFYENIERNHNVEYATTGFIHLVAQSKSPLVLSAIYELEPMQFHPKIKMAIAMNSAIDLTLAKKIYATQESYLHEALSLNPYLPLEIVKKLVAEGVFVENIAQTLLLDDEKLELLKAHPHFLAKNRTLNSATQRELLASDEEEVLLSLAQNPSLEEALFYELLQRESASLQKFLYKNSAAPKEVLEKAYAESLFLESLAQNEATPVEILYQLQLDSRYERYVKKNSGFGKHIQSENIGWLV